MKPEKRNQLIGGIIGLVIGTAAAYLIWGFHAPGGILILFAFATGGFVGRQIGRKKKAPGSPGDAADADKGETGEE